MANNLRLSASLGLDKTGFDVGLRAATASVGRFAGDLKSTLAGAFTVAAVTQFVRGVADSAGRIKDLSEQFAVTTDEVQNMDFALRQSGLSFENLGTALNSLGTKRRDAVEGNEELRETFLRYGITVGDLNNSQLRTVDILTKIAGSQKAANMTAKEQTELTDLLGPKSLKLVNILRELESVKPPAIISTEDIKRIDDATKALQNLKLEAQATASPVVGIGARIMSSMIKGGRMALGTLWNGGSPVDAVKANVGEVVGNGILGIGEMQKAVSDSMKGGMASVVSGIAGKILGVPEKSPSLWKEGSNKTAQPGFTAGFTPPGVGQPDQFQRIGAFTSVSAQAAQTEMQRRSMTALERIRDDLQRRGILVRTDP